MHVADVEDGNEDEPHLLDVLHAAPRTGMNITALRLVWRGLRQLLDPERGPTLQIHLAMLQQALMAERMHHAAAAAQWRKNNAGSAAADPGDCALLATQPQNLYEEPQNLYETLKKLALWPRVERFVAVCDLPQALVPMLVQCGVESKQVPAVESFVARLAWPEGEPALLLEACAKTQFW